MFFERRTQSSIKHRRLKYLLLFALRCAFIALLVLAFARPYIHSSAIARANSGRTMVFAIDNSFSMRQDDRFRSTPNRPRSTRSQRCIPKIADRWSASADPRNCSPT